MIIRLLTAAALLGSISGAVNAQTYYGRVVDGKAETLAVNPQSGQPVPTWCTGCVVLTLTQYNALLNGIESTAKGAFIPRDDFWDRFTSSEMDAIVARAIANPPILKRLITMPQRVNLGATIISNFLDSMIASGDLAAARKAVILAPP